MGNFWRILGVFWWLHSCQYGFLVLTWFQAIDIIKNAKIPMKTGQNRFFDHKSSRLEGIWVILYIYHHKGHYECYLPYKFHGQRPTPGSHRGRTLFFRLGRFFLSKSQNHLFGIVKLDSNGTPDNVRLTRSGQHWVIVCILFGEPRIPWLS